MLDVSSSNISNLYSKMIDMPEYYSDMRTIKMEFDYLYTYYQKMHYDNTLSLTDKLSESKSSLARDAYIVIKNFDEQHINWDCSSLLSEINKELVFGAKWTYINNTFYWYESNGGYVLQTNLPNNKEDEKEYYYYTEYKATSWKTGIQSIMFGYENKNDETDKFEAFNLRSISYKNGYISIIVECISNNTNYKMTYRQ